MKLILSLILISCGFMCLTQNDSISLVYNNTWIPKTTIYAKWLESNTIELNSIKSIEAIKDSLYKKDDLTEDEIVRLIYLISKDKERIEIDSSGTVKHIYALSCPVGETFYTLENLHLNSGKIKLTYSKKPWDAKEEEAVYITNNYNIRFWSENKIILSKTIE